VSTDAPKTKPTGEEDPSVLEHPLTPKFEPVYGTQAPHEQLIEEEKRANFLATNTEGEEPEPTDPTEALRQRLRDEGTTAHEEFAAPKKQEAKAATSTAKASSSINK
jgi:hypothetical protein